jgi:two-component system LytT family response regulator
MIKAIIIDDEKSNRDILNEYLIKYCKNVKVEAEAEGVKSSLDSIYSVCPDLVFLDVELKDESGFDILNQIRKINFKIIFVTGHREYAIKAFKYSASNYLLKPVNINELIDAVEKVSNEIKIETEYKNTQILMDIVNHQEKEIENIVITDSKGFKILQIKSIIKCQADGACTHFYLTDKTIIISSKNLGYFDYLLDSNIFIQVHRSVYINLLHVKEYISAEQTIYLSCNLNAPLGDHYKKIFLEHFNRK